MKSENLVFFDKNWEMFFTKESELLKSVLGDCFIESHHIGSTSIKNIFSKPKIDIALVVNNLENSKILEKVGYVYKGCFNIPFRYFFSKRSDDLNINLHVILPRDPELEGFIIFRDFMNKHEKLRDEYSNLKLKLEHLIKTKQNKYFFNDYTLSKNDFITRVLKLAGFKGFCMRLVSHYLEKAYESRVYEKFKDDEIRVVFYKGADIIGYANVDENTKNINFFQVDENEKYFQNRLTNYLESLK